MDQPTFFAPDAELQAAMNICAQRARAMEHARAAFEKALAEPSKTSPRVDLINCLNYLETLERMSS